MSRVDADRERFEAHRPRAEVDRVHPARDAQPPQHAVAEVLHVAVRVEGEEVRPRQSLQDLLPPRQQAKHRRRRERDVKEEPDAPSGIASRSIPGSSIS